MSDEAKHIALEKEAHGGTKRGGRRFSVPASWDTIATTTSVAKPSSVHRTRSAESMGSTDGSDGELSRMDSVSIEESKAETDAVAMISTPRPGRHLRSASRDLASLKASVYAQNANLASVDVSIAEHLRDMLAEVRKKKGLPLAEADIAAQKEAYKTLCTVPPFSYLPNQEIHALVKDLHLLEYQDGEIIVQQGQEDDDPDVYILAQQRIVMVKLHLEGGMIMDPHNRSQQQQQQQQGGSSGQSTPSSDGLVGGNSSTRSISTATPGMSMGRSTAKFIGYLDAPAYFGEWGTLFEDSRTSQVIAGGPHVVVYRMSGTRFEKLLQHSAFRLKLALGLRSNGIFADIEAFVAMLRRAVSSHEGEEFDVPAILASYRRMVPAIHANLHSPDLDLEGWTYAVRRLPDTITSTYTYLLSNHVPMPFMHSNFKLQDIFVKTVARRRQAFALDHGKLLVVMREKFSDVLDFVSLLCCHMHESAKLRTKLVRPSALDIIHNCLWKPARRSTTTEHVGDRRSLYNYCQSTKYAPASIEEQAEALTKLPLTFEEQEGLQALWPKDFLYRIWDIIALHENVQIRSDLASSYVDATDRWAERIRRSALELFSKGNNNTNIDDCAPCRSPLAGDVCLRTEVVTHIISSNTTSVRNLLSPYLLQRKAEILKWGSEAHPEIMEHEVLSDSDKFCSLCNAYMHHNGHKAIEEQTRVDGECFKILRSTEMTGIQVELIDLNALETTYAQLNISPDPFLSTCFPNFDPATKSWNKEPSDSNDPNKKARLLINIDYAFGKQAEQLISALSLLFGKSVASVGIMGKAGGLQGRRGDIIVADYLVHQEGDEQTLIDNTGVDRKALHTLSQRTVHSGGVLTVLGTLLQDARLLNFYKKLYGCVSLEMEGSFYARELRRYKKAGLLSNDVNLRFLYYVSDTPLSQDQTETLSSDMSLAEVIPPQYAVTRALLKPVLSQR